jgi:hypothetical protein
MIWYVIFLSVLGAVWTSDEPKIKFSVLVSSVKTHRRTVMDDTMSREASGVAAGPRSLESTVLPSTHALALKLIGLWSWLGMPPDLSDQED